MFVLPPNHRLRGIHSYHSGHPRAKPWYHQGVLTVLRSYVSVLASAQVLFSATQSFLFQLWPRWGFSDALPHQARSLSFMISMEHLPYELVLSRPVSLLPCVSPLPWNVLPTYPVPSIKRKLRSAGYWGTSGWQPMFPFMGVVDCSTTSPFFINWFLSLGFKGGLSSLSREIWGYLIYEPSCIVFTFFL